MFNRIPHRSGGDLRSGVRDLPGLSRTAVALLAGLAIGIGTDARWLPDCAGVLLAIPIALKCRWRLLLAGRVDLSWRVLRWAVKSGSSTITVTWIASVFAGGRLRQESHRVVRHPPPKVARLWMPLVQHLGNPHHAVGR